MASGEVSLESPAESDEDYTSISSDSDTDCEKMALEMMNFRSKNFNATLVLKSPSSEINVPVKDAPLYLNLQQYDKAIKDPKNVKEIFVSKTSTTNEDNTTNEKEPTTNSVEPHFPMPGRRFLPHQMPVYRPRKKHPNTLTLMNEVQGPLSRLAKVMEEKTKIKVWTRNANGIRGFCVGFLEAFDKHWNLAMRDVDEQFQRKKVIKYPAECKESNDSVSKVVRKSKDNRKTKTKKLLKILFENCENKDDKSVNKSCTKIVEKNRVMMEARNTLQVLRLGLSTLSLQNNDIVKPAACSRNSSSTSTESGMSFQQKPETPRPDILSIGAASDEKIIKPKQICSDVSEKSLPSKSQIKKKALTVFQDPYKDHNGFSVIAKSKKYEIVERHIGQVLLMGNDVVFVEILTGK